MMSKCLRLRDVVIFLAGAEFFHTLVHILLPYTMQFPIVTHFSTVSLGMNRWAIVVNGLITILLLWWAKRLSKKAQ